MRNLIVRHAAMASVDKALEVLYDELDSERFSTRLKFGLYIVLLVAIFFILGRRMASNMKTDIAKTLSVINVMPTTYLASNTEMLKTLNNSGLIS
ncbi:MAG: hypothetical protein P4M11_09435 [Candidatus Pacebacteria bacterium]|nr:hypothetical protein [Candidatus Paceibacterota bacterium]